MGRMLCRTAYHGGVSSEIAIMIYPVPPVYLIDASNQEWSLACSNGGQQILTNPVSGQQAVPYILVNDIAPYTQQTWQFLIVPNPSPYPNASPGDLYILPVAYSPSAGRQIMFNSPDGNLWWLQISDGGLVLNPGTSGSCTPIVGSLYIKNWNNIAWSQPGGIGTTVYPQQQVNTAFTDFPVAGQTWSEIGLWVSSCGHWLDTWEIFRDINICTNQSAAIVACPVCSNIQQVITPYEAIFDVLRYPIVVG